MTARLRPEAIAALQERAVLKRTTNPDDVARQVVLFCARIPSRVKRW